MGTQEACVDECSTGYVSFTRVHLHERRARLTPVTRPVLLAEDAKGPVRRRYVDQTGWCTLNRWHSFVAPASLPQASEGQHPQRRPRACNAERNNEHSAGHYAPRASRL